MIERCCPAPHERAHLPVPLIRSVAPTKHTPLFGRELPTARAHRHVMHPPPTFTSHLAAQVQLVRCALQPVLAHAALQLRWAVTPAWFASGRARGAALAW